MSFSAYDSFAAKQEKLNSYSGLTGCTSDHAAIDSRLFEIVNVAATYISQVRNLALTICSIDAIFLLFVLFMMVKTQIMANKSNDSDFNSQ